MIDSDMFKMGQFWVLRGKYLLLRQWCNVLVEAHVRTTPTSATDDTLREIIQEQLRERIRKVEFRCHSLKERYTALGKELLHVDTTETYQGPTGAGANTQEAAHEAPDP